MERWKHIRLNLIGSSSMHLVHTAIHKYSGPAWTYFHVAIINSKCVYALLWVLACVTRIPCTELSLSKNHFHIQTHYIDLANYLEIFKWLFWHLLPQQFWLCGIRHCCYYWVLDTNYATADNFRWKWHNEFCIFTKIFGQFWFFNNYMVK